jgi:dihydrofolate reductase
MSSDEAKPVISIIVAVAKNGVIGFRGDMPWRLSTDLKRFKKLTLGKPVIMGRKTFESIGKALPGRTNIVITRNPQWQGEGAVAVRGIDQALELAPTCPGGEEEVFVIGGGQIYEQAMRQATKLYVTHVDAQPVGDTEFPEIDQLVWHLKSTENVPAGENDTLPSRFAIYGRSEVPPINSNSAN